MRHLVRGRYSRTGAMSMTTPTTARRRGPQEPPVRLWVRRAKTGGGPVGQSLARHPVLSEMPTFDKESGDLRVVIETPKGSRNKYDCSFQGTAFLLRIASLKRLNRRCRAVPGNMDCC